MSQIPVIEVSSVSKRFKRNKKSGTVKSGLISLGNRKSEKINDQPQALSNITFNVNRGEFFGIVGRNGSGKSTLLKLLAGIYRPSEGSIKVTGKLVPFIELGVGFNPELTGRENIYLNGALLGFSKSQVDRMFDDIVDFAELNHYIDEKLKNYSSGMQVRLAFSMAIRAEAQILLVDEVLAVGDADFQRKCFDYFRKLKKQNQTVVFVSHDMDAVREYCDRVLLIDDSHIKFIGSSNEAANRYKQLFIDEFNEAETDDESSVRWGEGLVRYTDVKVSPKKVTGDVEKIELVCKATSSVDVRNLIFGFSVTDALGNNLLGTNTEISNSKKYSLKSGQTVSLTWQIPNIFNDGKHHMNVAIVDSTGVITYDWWDEACSFVVLTKRKTPYLVNPKVKLSSDS